MSLKIIEHSLTGRNTHMNIFKKICIMETIFIFKNIFDLNTSKFLKVGVVPV